MNMTAISIIMPVYNTAAYLEESINCILQQTCANFELICVNDASDDDSLAILEEFQRKDDRIVIINHETNCGAAISRNDGLKAAKGEYVIFLDSDDSFYPNMLEESYGQAVEHRADVVIFGSETVGQDSTEAEEKGYQFQLIDSMEKKLLFLPSVRHVPWDKLVRKDLLLKNNIWFQNLPANNDVFYSFAVMLVANQIVVSDKLLLGYRYGRTGSLTAIRFSKQNYTIDAFNELFLFGVKNGTGIDERLKVVFMNLLTDNIQKFLSDAIFSLEMRRESHKKLLGYEKLVDALKHYTAENLLYPHNRKFVENLIKGKDVCGIRYYDYYVEGIRDIVTERKEKHKRIALWGLGQNGKKLLELICDKNISIDYVVDENRKMHGEKYRGYTVVSYDEAADDVDTVLITNLRYKEEIESRAVGKEIVYVWK